MKPKACSGSFTPLRSVHSPEQAQDKKKVLSLFEKTGDLLLLKSGENKFANYTRGPRGQGEGCKWRKLREIRQEVRHLPVCLSACRNQADRQTSRVSRGKEGWTEAMEVRVRK